MPADSACAVLPEPGAATQGAERDRASLRGREIMELTAHISAAEARFFELLAEFDRDGLWRCLGCHSAAHWLTWQCGFGEIAARERVRVARALEKLPEISAAFRRGELSYSKVRELTRVARPETERALLDFALRGTAAQVQRIVALHRRVEHVSAAADAVAQYRRRYVRYRHDDDGTVLIEARLPAEIGEVVIRALDAAVEVLYRDAASRRRTTGNRPSSNSEPDLDVTANPKNRIDAPVPDVIESATDRIAKDDVSAGTCTHNGAARTQADFETASRAPAETLPHDGLDVCAAEVEDVDARTEVSSASEPAEIDNAGIDNAEKENAEIGNTEVDNTEVHNTEISNTLEPRVARTGCACSPRPSCLHRQALASIRPPTAIRSSCTSTRRCSPVRAPRSARPATCSKVTPGGCASSRTGGPWPSKLRGALRAMRRSSASSTARTASRSTSAAARGRSPPCSTPRASCPGRRMPISRMRPHAIHGGTSRRALGRRRRDEPPQPAHAMHLSPHAFP